MANTSRNPNAVLSDAEQRGYSRMLFQQGKPVCDFELTLLGDLSNPRRIAAPYIGSGVPADSDGFAIDKLNLTAGDFRIRAGRCLVNGNEVVLLNDTTYKSQPHEQRVGPFESEKVNVYLHVFPTEITEKEDADLNNDGDVGVVTAIREKTDWEVLAVEGDLNQPDHFLLATIVTDGDVADKAGVESKVIDRRRKGLTMATLRDEFDALGGSTASPNDRLNASFNPDGTLKDNVVGNVQLANNAVTGAKILDGSLTGTKLAANAITGTQLADNAVTTNKIVDGSVNGKKLAANAVGNTQLADGAVTTNKIVDGSVNNKKLAANAVGNTQLADGAVTVNKILDGSVNDKKLAASAVGNTQLADASVTVNKIVDGSVIGTKLAPNAINEVNLQTNSVSKRTIQDKAVSMAELGLTLVFDGQASLPPATLVGPPGQQVVVPSQQFIQLLTADAHAFFLISVRLISPRQVGVLNSVNWMQRSVVVLSAAAGNPVIHQHQVALQNLSTTATLTVGCRAFRLAET